MLFQSVQSGTNHRQSIVPNDLTVALRVETTLLGRNGYAGYCPAVAKSIAAVTRTLGGDHCAAERRATGFNSDRAARSECGVSSNTDDRQRCSIETDQTPTLGCSGAGV